MGSDAQHVDEVVQQIAQACSDQAQGISDVTRTFTQLGQSTNRTGSRGQSSELVQIN
jgi:hypothetical protein